MAFGFLKKIGKAVVSVPGKVAGVIKKIPRPLKDVAIEVLPTPIRTAVKVVDKVIPITGLFKGGEKMNPLEKVLRSLVETIEALKDGIGVTDVGVLVDFLMSASSAFSSFNEATDDQKVQMLREALDNLMGTEADALIGPNGKIKLDIPIVDDELATDVVIDGITGYMRKKLEEAAGQ